MGTTRIRWRNVARLIAGAAVATLLIALVGSMLKPKPPEPLPNDVGLDGVTGQAVAYTPPQPRHSHDPNVDRPAPDHHRAPVHEKPRRKHPPAHHAPSAHGPPAEAGAEAAPTAPSPPALAPAPVAPPSPAPPVTPPAPEPAPTHEESPDAAPHDPDPPPQPQPHGPSQFGFER